VTRSNTQQGGKSGAVWRIALIFCIGIFEAIFPASAHAACVLQGKEIKEGNSVQAFMDAYIPPGGTCVSQTRTCRGGKLTGGYFHPTCQTVPFVKQLGAGHFQRSDVMLSVRLSKHYYNQPWYDVFNQFHANRIVWTYAGEQLLQDPRVVDKIPVQCALEYWVPTGHLQRDQMSCQKKDSSGNLLGYAEHPVYKLRVPDTNTQAWRDFAAAKAKRLVFLGCGSFVQDVPAIMAVTRNTRGFIGDGCHSEESEALFKKFRRDHQDATYPDFMKHSVLEYHGWLHKVIRQAAEDYDPSYKISFAANTSAVTPAHIEEDRWFFPLFDFLQTEIFGDFSRNDVSKTMTELIRYLGAKDSKQSPTVLALRSDTTDPNNVNYLRRTTMSAYALGMVPIIPWTASALTNNPLNYFFADPKDFSDIYATIRTWPELFDNFAPGDVDSIVRPGKTFNSSRSLRTSSGDYLVTSRTHVGGGPSKAISVVNWTGNQGPAWIDLKKSEHSRKPNRMLRLGDAKPVAIAAEDNGEYFRYNLGAAGEWMILFHSE
jgi:hypothetical protein